MSSAVLAVDATEDRPEPIASRGFIPNKLPAFVALGVCGQTAFILWTQYFRFGRPSYMTTLTLGMTGMSVGFALRMIFARSPSNMTLYIVEDLFILLSPCTFLAKDYVLFARLASTFDANLISGTLLIRPAWIVRIFVWSDVITFLVQTTGGSMSTSHNVNTGHLGTKISMIGLVLQLFSFLFFTYLLIVWGCRVLRTNHTPTKSRFPSLRNFATQPAFKILQKDPSPNWRLLYWTMCLNCVGILMFAAGYNGYLAEHEGHFYIFDSFTLWVSMSLYCLVWPTRFLEPHMEGIKLVSRGSNELLMFRELYGYS
ncbi:RTA1 like protein-domain-containing protein [Roridomyces roridus]|uniref:RTA1 like protein-domain-containing protein n=1 Tax=Roridomyces roridus TaxID=1738132 RepID=A0AAD7C1H0_9AGAR|nr:RTA1 like protein-domain-containing protein [Roridomyces roridus]